MGRGLSPPQKSILTMAHQHFLEAAEKQGEEFKGLSYEVYVGPEFHRPETLFERWYGEAVKTARLFGDGARYDELKARVEAREDGYLERVRQARASLGEKFHDRMGEVLPDLLWGKDGEMVEHRLRRHWEPTRDYWVRPEYDRLYVIKNYMSALENNAPEVRKIVGLLEDLGPGYSWSGYGGVYSCEILEALYGFEPIHKYQERAHDYIKFDPEQIGAARYNSARASLSRTLTRLYERTLIERSAAASATITLEGVAEVTGITVKEVCDHHNINRKDAQGEIVLGPPPPPPPASLVSEEELRRRGEIVAGLRESL